MADRVRQRHRMVVEAAGAGRLHIVRRVVAEAAADRQQVLAAAAGLAVGAVAMSHPAAVAAVSPPAEALAVAMPHLVEAAEATAVGVTKFGFLAGNKRRLPGRRSYFRNQLEPLYKPRCFRIPRASYRLVYDCITLPG